jgi:hypothetical protein
MSLQPNSPSFKQTQYSFSAYIRDPQNNARPEGIEQRRMKIYQELFYNNIEGFVSNAFPVLREITSDEKWHRMVRDFMAHHKSKTPLFHEIAREFLSYLESERDTSNDPVFIKELAHYEWVELAVSVMDAEDATVSDSARQQALNHKFNTADLAWPLAYHYPVQHISPSFQPEQANETPVFLLVYRDKNDKVTFMELNPVSARLIDLLNEDMQAIEAAQQIATELNHPQPEVVIDGAKQLLDDWISRGILTEA